MYTRKRGQLFIDNFQDKNTPALVSLAAGGIAGGVEGFLSVCIDSRDEEKGRVTD
jgi:hypothetical protein